MRALAFFTAIFATFLTSETTGAEPVLALPPALALQATVADQPITEADAIEADRLFVEGRALVEAGRIVEGCAFLAKSQEIDPSAGTLLNLALCHEAEGKSDAARDELLTSLAIARRDGRNDREEVARTHLAAIDARRSTPRLSPDEPTHPAPLGLDLVVTAAVFFASGSAAKRSRVRRGDRKARA